MNDFGGFDVNVISADLHGVSRGRRRHSVLTLSRAFSKPTCAEPAINFD
jgi:hypothetical protein